MERVKYHSELHNHDTIGSILDGFGTPKEMMDRCDELGIYGYATTNHGTEYALYYFAEIEEKYKTKTLYGIEFYECDDHTVQDPDNKYYHLLVIAKNDRGITALHQLTTIGEFEGKYYKPRIDLEQLKPYANDLIIGSACLASKLNRGTYEDMKRSALEYKEIFGDNFYIELQAHTSDDQIQYNKKLMKLHYDTGIPYIITSDSHYIKKEDALKHSKFINVNRNNADTTTIGEIYENCYLHSTDEMYEIMFQSGLTEDEITIGLQNTNHITDICNGKVKFGNPELPEVQIPEEFKNSKEYFLHLIYQGWKDRNMEEQIKNDTRHTREEYMARLEKEINVISEMGFIDYHLIVADYMQWTVNQGIPTGFGRGCCLGHTLIQTKNKLKMIKDIQKGEYVLTADGKWNKVLDTFVYDINEPMVEFKYKHQGSSYKKYTSTYTLNHKILVNRNNNIDYIEAGDLKIGDLLCYPKIKPNDNPVQITYDLNKYNIFGYEYDDNYIYEKYPTNNSYDYSPSWLYERGIVTKTFAKRVGRGWKPVNSRGDKNIKALLDNTPFKSLDDYYNYFQKHAYTVKKIPRYVTMDSLLNTFVAMMYGDGFTDKDNGLGLAINHTTKNNYNRYVFEKVAIRFNLNIHENVSKSKNLIQLYMNSKILNNWFVNEFFKSKKGVEKIFNPELLNQKQSYLKCLYNGLLRTDGHTDEYGVPSFDSTSLSLINVFKILNNILGYKPMNLDIRLAHTDNRGYNCQEAYKLTRYKCTDMLEDNNYWFLPITEINLKSCDNYKVYDIAVENNHSYVNNNIVAHNSGAGSMVNYLLKITNINPIPHDLIFERYLNPERISLPDCA